MRNVSMKETQQIPNFFRKPENIDAAVWLDRDFREV
jgi:hypothetical protein